MLDRIRTNQRLTLDAVIFILGGSYSLLSFWPSVVMVTEMLLFLSKKQSAFYCLG